MNLQSKIDSLFSKPINVLLGCVVFVLVGWFLFMQSELISKIIGIVNMFFFGFGAIIYAWSLMRVKHNKSEDKIKYTDSPSEIIVQKVAIDDDEVEEYWHRTGHHFQQVSAAKNKDRQFSWSVFLASGEFFRDGDGLEYSQPIYDSINGVAGVKETVREDREHWAVDGDCDGEELVRAAAFANDQFLRRYYEQTD